MSLLGQLSRPNTFSPVIELHDRVGFDVIWILFEYFCALWSPTLYVFTNMTHLRGADRWPRLPEGPERLRRAIRFTPIFDLNTYKALLARYVIAL
jgi:hypothetical protein